MDEPTEMSRHDAETLLGSGVAGRVGFCAADGPHVVPVNYSVVDDAVMLRTTPYSELATAARDSVVAFEVDDLDVEQHRGWSVVVRGRMEAVTDRAELDRVDEVWPPRPWAGGHRPLLLRIPLDEVSGRVVGRGWDPVTAAKHRRSVGL